VRRSEMYVQWRT